MNEIEELTELFTKFPGIGPRQARRFVFFLLRKESGYTTTLIKAINDAIKSVRRCTSCMRYTSLHHSNTLCSICSDTQRSREQLMIVEKDTDIDQMEKSGAYMGKYFVIGGVLSLTGKKQYIREKEFDLYMEKYCNEIGEIILALSTTTDGEYTTEYFIGKIKDLKTLKDAAVSVLGRGLSTGAELEYADATTLTQALKNRNKLYTQHINML